MKPTLDGRNGLLRNDLSVMQTAKVIRKRRTEKKKDDSRLAFSNGVSAIITLVVFNSSSGIKSVLFSIKPDACFASILPGFFN